MALPHPAVELRGFRGGANVLHGNGLWGEEAEGVLVLVLEKLGWRGCGYGRSHMVLLLLAKVELGLDLENLRWGEFVEAYGRSGLGWNLLVVVGKGVSGGGGAG